MGVMNDDAALLTIGELARASGLSISALRFYDRQGGGSHLPPSTPPLGTVGMPLGRSAMPNCWALCDEWGFRWRRAPLSWPAATPTSLRVFSTDI